MPDIPGRSRTAHPERPGRYPGQFTGSAEKKIFSSQNESLSKFGANENNLFMRGDFSRNAKKSADPRDRFTCLELNSRFFSGI
jgi:hypothetical protein